MKRYLASLLMPFQVRKQTGTRFKPCVRRLMVLVSILMLVVAVPAVAIAGHSVSCRADFPVQPFQSMTWRAFVTGGSGNFQYTWSGADGLTGATPVVTKLYAAPGGKEAIVNVLDTALGDSASVTCGMHVVPASFTEPPNVNPVLWVPRGVDPTPLLPQLQRVWRSIRASYFHLYGKTFRMNPVQIVVSSRTEQEICGGDCTDLRKADSLVGQALADAEAAVGGVLPYTRVIQVMVWGAGGWAGSWGWDIGKGATGDIAVTPAAGAMIPAIEPDLADWLAALLGDFKGSVSTIAHELNHGIAWDDPHDFNLETRPNDYERQVSLAGPFLTETPADTTHPSITMLSPAHGATVNSVVTVEVAAWDETAMDAVILLVDGQFRGVDTAAPFSFDLDTTRVGHGRHQITAIAYDAAGNTTEAEVDIVVHNEVAATRCDLTYPAGTFHVCYYDGIGFGGPFLGMLVDHPFPVATSNAGWGFRHDFAEGGPFGQSATVSGVWHGTLDFPRGNYILRFFTDDGLRAWIDDRLVVDHWQDGVQQYESVVALDGPTRIKVEWYNNFGGQALSFRWQPTNEPPAPIPPRPPSNCTATPKSPVRIELGWQDNNDNETSFIIQRKTGPGGAWGNIATVGANVTSYTNKKLTPNTEHFYRVKTCITGMGCSGFCDADSATTYDIKPPSDLTATPESAVKIVLGWHDSNNDKTSFIIQRKTGPGGAWGNIATVGANMTSYTNTGLSPNTTYFYRVKTCIAGSGCSGFSTEAWAKTHDLPAPSNLTATAVSSRQIDLLWQDNSAGETSFKIERKTGTGGTWAPIATLGANAKTYRNTGLIPNTTYFYRVKACIAVGCSALSNEASATTKP